MSDTAIRVEGLSKKFNLPSSSTASYRTLRDALAGVFTRSQRTTASSAGREFWALQDVTFEVKPGEVVGLIGRNGAGKSTLLKVLSRITDPTTGFADISGRVGSLLEVGTGFHPELSGRENIFLNGAILGMRRAEIRGKFDEIVAFAEVEQFIDTPVKFYSSGMFVRLAFAVAAHLEPEILFVDEVLAVGDAAFQKKCLGKMGAVARSGRTVVLVSHNMGAISELCTHGALLDRGRVVFYGSTQEAVEGYGRLLSSGAQQMELIDRPNRTVSITGARVLDEGGSPVTHFDIHDQVVVEFDYLAHQRLHGLQLAVTISRNYVDLFQTFNTDQQPDVGWVNSGAYRASLRLPGRFLKAGQYSVRVAIGTSQELMQDLEGILSFEIEELTENTHHRGYYGPRPGHLISPGQWQTTEVVKCTN